MVNAIFLVAKDVLFFVRLQPTQEPMRLTLRIVNVSMLHLSYPPPENIVLNHPHINLGAAFVAPKSNTRTASVHSVQRRHRFRCKHFLSRQLVKSSTIVTCLTTLAANSAPMIPDACSPQR